METPIAELDRLLWQARRKAWLISKRNVRLFTEGKIHVLPCGGDMEREFIREAMQRAFHLGVAAGQRTEAA